MDGFRRNLVDRLGVSRGRIDSIFVKIRIWIWKQELFNFLSDSSPLRDWAKNDIVLYSMIFQKLYWTQYVLVDQALRGGGMSSTECPSSYLCDDCTASHPTNQ